MGARELCGHIRSCWEHGKSVLLFDNKGDNRAVVAACCFLAAATYIPGRVWLTTVYLPRRQVAEVFYEQENYYNVLGCKWWAPKSYDDFILVARIVTDSKGLLDKNTS